MLSDPEYFGKLRGQGELRLFWFAVPNRSVLSLSKDAHKSWLWREAPPIRHSIESWNPRWSPWISFCWGNLHGFRPPPEWRGTSYPRQCL